jgi:hypothetical protein
MNQCNGNIGRGDTTVIVIGNETKRDSTVTMILARQDGNRDRSDMNH